HGVALFNAERQLMWARAAQNLTLKAGVHVFSHTFPSLPLRPGAYQWQVSLWDNDEMLDTWDCIPEMTIGTETHQHYVDEWKGIPLLFRNSSRMLTPSARFRRPHRECRGGTQTLSPDFLRTGRRPEFGNPRSR